MKKQAVAYINYRVVDLDLDTGVMVQHRFASMSHFEEVIVGMKASKKDRKNVLGYKNRNVIIEIEGYYVAKEYALYMQKVYGDKNKFCFKSGSRATDKHSIDKVVGENLCVELVESNGRLDQSRQATKDRYDARAVYLLHGYKKNVSENKERGLKNRVEIQLEKVKAFARENNLIFDNYIDSHKEMSWECEVCGCKFVAKYKRVKDRKIPCKNCARIKSINNEGARGIKKYAKRVGLIVDCANYKKEIGSISKLIWTCKHGKCKKVSFHDMKKKVRASEKCPICKT